VSPVRIRADLADVPAYRPGRGPEPSGGRGPAFKCSSNENPHPPLPGVLAAIAAAAGEVNRYPDMAVSTLTAALSRRWKVPGEHVVCGPGSVGVLQQLVAALAGPGDEVVFAWRSFEAYPIIARVAGARAVPVPLTTGYRHDVDAMAAAVTPRTRVVLVCSPNNPTGPVVTGAELARLLERVPDDVLVVVDEAYVEFVRDPDAADGLAAYRSRDNVAVLRTFSKAYGLAGLRIGYGIVPEPAATAVRAASIPFGVSSLAEAAALASLEQEAALLARVDAIVAERDRVQRGLADAGWSVPESQANFFWFDLGAQAEAFAAACGASGLSVRTFPGEGVRVSIAEPEANDLLLQVAASHAPPPPPR
jgi:histidinol-phosphate aminotransferase